MHCTPLPVGVPGSFAFSWLRCSALGGLMVITSWAVLSGGPELCHGFVFEENYKSWKIRAYEERPSHVSTYDLTIKRAWLYFYFILFLFYFILFYFYFKLLTV